MYRKKQGENQNLWLMTKKRSSEFLADENPKIFRETATFRKMFKFFLENRGGKSETGRKCIMASGGMDTPAMICCMMFFLRCTLLRTSSFVIFCEIMNQLNQ